MGTVVVAGRSFPVTALALTGGELEITAEGPGPSPALTGEPVTVFGQDGRGFAQGGRIDVRAAGPLDRVHLTVGFRFARILD